MTALANIRTGLSAALSTIADVQVNAYQLANPSPPSLTVMGPREVLYDTVMGRGGDEWQLTVMALIGLAADIGAQKQLDALLASSGATSVKAAIEVDRTLGGVCESLRVTRCSGYQLYTLAGRGEFLGAEWTVEIHAAG